MSPIALTLRPIDRLRTGGHVGGFQPLLPARSGDYESRNASPDRLHNETWDLLVISGVLGFIAYMALFLSIFYFALKWLGLTGFACSSYGFLD